MTEVQPCDHPTGLSYWYHHRPGIGLGAGEPKMNQSQLPPGAHSPMGETDIQRAMTVQAHKC